MKRQYLWALLGLLVVAVAGFSIFAVLGPSGTGPVAAPTSISTPKTTPTKTSSPTNPSRPTPAATPAARTSPSPSATLASTATLTSIITLEGVSIPAGKAAFLRNKDVWVTESGRSEQAVTAFGDVEAILGWNKDATMLLFGRGRKQQRPHIGDTTELWLFNSSSKATKQLTSGSNVHSAAWSPVDDRIAYCEQGRVLSVVDTDGKILRRLSNAACYFSWSTDGWSIAVVTATPESIAETNIEIYDFLTVWQLTGDQTIQIRTERGLVYDPLWSVDSRTVIFQHATTGTPQSVWHVADVTTGSSRQLAGTPKIVADFVTRSPGADVLIFRVDQTIYAMDFAGKIQTLDAGRSPTWLPHGKTIIYRDATGKLRLLTRDLAPAVRQGTGRSLEALGLYSPPDYFLAE